METVRDVLEQAIRGAAFPGCAAAWGTSSRAWFAEAGGFTYCPESQRVLRSTIWDLASVSKVVGCTTAAMIAEQDGKLDLDRPVARDLAEFGAGGKEAVSARDLLTHRSGLPAFRGLHRAFVDAGEALSSALATPLATARGEKAVYSDLGMIALGALIARLYGTGLDSILAARAFRPLGMRDTQYRPRGVTRLRCAITEPVEAWRLAVRRHQQVESLRGGPYRPEGDYWIQGEVHDPNAMVLGGVAGHAGLFSTAPDLARYCQAMLRGAPPFERAQLARWLRKQNDDSTRALGWDTKSAEGSSSGALFSMASVGHTGYTGTSIWIDLERQWFGVLLTNRVHPSAENLKISEVRPKFYDAVGRFLEVQT